MALSTVSELIHDVRNIAHRLRPQELEGLGLTASVRAHLDRFARLHKITVDFRESLGERRLPPEIELCIFRLIQEGLTNCLRHASAHHFEVELALVSGKLMVVIRDDGVGMPVVPNDASPPEGLGLIGMKERVVAAGGKLDIRSRKGEGTEIMASFIL